MLIEIPDDLARKAKQAIDPDSTGPVLRGLAAYAERSNVPLIAVNYLVLAALVEADLPERVQVGHLARSVADDATFLVLALGRKRALLETEWGWETSRPIAYLTYAGPKPEGWGEQ